MRKFKLWLEFEAGTGWKPETSDFANILVTLDDGREYGINVWTYDFLQEAKKEEGNLFVIPPDLFVDKLTPDCIEQTISKLLAEGELEEQLNPSVFNLHFPDPWQDCFEMPDQEQVTIRAELALELPIDHRLHNLAYDLLAKRQDNDDILIELETGELVLIHLTWSGKKEQDNFPITTYFPSARIFWQQVLKPSILEYRE